MYSKHTATLMALVHELQQQAFTNVIKKITLERSVAQKTAKRQIIL
jgi:ABC-type arginine transport system ATPase subunit